MRPELHEGLIRDTEALRSLLAKCSTETIVGMSNALLLHWFGANGHEAPLVSPMRQILFMLGIMLTTEEPPDPQSFGEEEFEQAVPLLNRIFHAYALMYWPENEELSNMPEEWRSRREVAMATFLHYFNTVLTASLEQIRERILRYLSPFDDEFERLVSISASQSLGIAEWLIDTFQKSADRLVELVDEEAKARRSLVERAEREGWDIDRIRNEASKGSYLKTAQEMFDLLTNHMKTQLSDIEHHFGEDTARAFWGRFISKRDGHCSFTYLTESNPVEHKPLVLLPDGRAMCPSPNFLLTAILEGLEKDILASPSREGFLKHRDKALEEEVVHQFGRIFPSNALYPNVYETDDLQFEHDLIVYWEGNVLAVESKASRPREPLRDPERAFVRIRDDFRSERGVQGAYDQAYRISSRLQAGSTLTLFDRNRTKVLILNPTAVSRVHCVCITRDSFGPLSVDLSLLLQKPKASSYPWAIGILDFAYLLDTWLYFQWGPEQLLRFLDERVRLHGKVTSFDELELAGFFIEHGSLEPLIRLQADRVMLSIDYSDVFDKVYAINLGGIPPVYSPTEPRFRFISPRIALASPS